MRLQEELYAALGRVVDHHGHALGAHLCEGCYNGGNLAGAAHGHIPAEFCIFFKKEFQDEGIIARDRPAADARCRESP